MTIAGEAARKKWSKVRHEELFICILISRFIYLIFLSTSFALNILSLYQLFRDFENFMALFGRFWLWAPTHFPEVICPKYGAANLGNILIPQPIMLADKTV